MTRVLALETSTAHASVAVCAGGHVLATETSTSQRTHSEFINPAIDRCLQKAGIGLADVDVFAAGLGPGSFTGLRVSGNIAKTFSMTFKKPLVTLDSLTLLMMESRRRGAQEPKILALLNAHKNMNYTALFSSDQVEIKPCAMTISDLNQLDLQSSSPVLCVGEGYLAYEKFFAEAFKSQIVRQSEFSDYPLASTLGLAAEDLLKKNQTIEWNLFEPLYIRASEAEENQRLKSR
jgi:tRNA threonylcarbamoyl adenosine modification protein YeaZ